MAEECTTDMRMMKTTVSTTTTTYGSPSYVLCGENVSGPLLLLLFRCFSICFGSDGEHFEYGVDEAFRGLPI